MAKKSNEKFFSGGYHDRIPAIFLLCIMVAGGVWKYSEGIVEERMNTDIPMFIGIIFWAILAALLFTIARGIMLKVFAKKEEERFEEKQKEMMEREKKNQ